MRLMKEMWASFVRSDSVFKGSGLSWRALEEVRLAMVSAIDEHPTEDGQALRQQLLYAHDIDGLWYLRPNLMVVLAARSGEATARQRLKTITALFQGHHPGAVASRSSFA